LAVVEEKLKYEFEGKIAPSAVAAYLEMLAVGLRNGRTQIDASGAGAADLVG
jgi:hypothetical protein